MVVCTLHSVHAHYAYAVHPAYILRTLYTSMPIIPIIPCLRSRTKNREYGHNGVQRVTINILRGVTRRVCVYLSVESIEGRITPPIYMLRLLKGCIKGLSTYHVRLEPM